MAFIEPMHRNKPNITYLLTYYTTNVWSTHLFIYDPLVEKSQHNFMGAHTNMANDEK